MKTAIRKRRTFMQKTTGGSGMRPAATTPVIALITSGSMAAFLQKLVHAASTGWKVADLTVSGLAVLSSALRLQTLLIVGIGSGTRMTLSSMTIPTIPAITWRITSGWVLIAT